MPKQLLRFAIVLPAIACTDPQTRIVGEFRWSRDTVTAAPQTLHSISASDDSTPEIIGYPLHVRADDSLIFVADRSTDRVAVLDGRGRIIRWIGAKGRGPGEILGIAHLAVRQNTLLVAEALNGRVSQFTPDGVFIRTYLSPFAAGAIDATRASVFAAARSPSHYAMRLEQASEPRPVFRRAGLARHEVRERWSSLPGHDLVAADSATLWILDQGSAALCAFHPRRATPSCRQLPGDLVERLRRYRDERVAAFERAAPVRIQAAPLAKDMVLVGTHIALLLPLPDLPVVIIDIADGEVTPVIHIGDSLPAWAQRATSFAWDDGSFILVSDEGIGRLQVPRLRTLY